MSSLILTIDLGTSGPKVSLFDTKARCIGYAFEEVPLLLSEGGGAEQRPSDWLNAIKTCYKRLVAETGANTKNIIAANCTAQWSGTVCVDKNGNELMNSIIWMDTRGAEYVKQLTHGPIRVEGYGVGKIMKWIRLTGGGPTKSGKDSIAHILYIKNKLRETYDRTYKFLEPKDYLNLWLTGRFCASYDSITLHWVTDNRDISNITYHDGLLQLSGIDKEKLPELVPANSVIGTVSKTIADELNLNYDVKVVSGTPDLQSAAIGSGAIRDFEGHMYIGTSSWLVCHVPFKKTDVFHNMGTIPSAIPGRYIIANEQETAGACLNFLKNNLLYHNDEFYTQPAPEDFYKMVDRAVARVAPGSEGVLFLPWMYGERSPVDDHYVRGGFYNLSLSNNREHIMRAVLEGVSLNARWLLMYVEKMIVREFDSINFIGGGANSAVWSQIIADILNRPVKQVKEPLMANSRGTAMLALMALGMMDADTAAKAVEINKVFEPNKQNKTLYDERFERFVEIYNRNKPIWMKLNK
ncbi:MAG: FGGY-family carbohydrate kinase [Chitinophagales bacterium]|nr:FGGY-family carbohydrate kinase [Chitinophagales bacterium]